MDDLELSSEQLLKNLDEIASINKFLGGHMVALGGIKKIIKALGIQEGESLKIVDLGCGKGDTLQVIQEKIGGQYNLSLLGIDANKTTVQYAQNSNLQENILIANDFIDEKNISKIEADIMVFSLFLHHFNDNEISDLLGSIDRKKVRAILINDLERSVIALILYKFISFVFNLDPMTKYDGYLSIKKGFIKHELSLMIDKIFKKHSISRKWAFRYQVTTLTS